MSKSHCPICLGAKTEMKEVKGRLKYVECNVCDENGEVEDSMFEHYDDEELV